MKKLILLFLSFCAFQSFAQVPAISATSRWQVMDGNSIFAIAAADVVTYAQANLSGLAPTGGSTGQVLTKINGTNYNYSWQTPTSGISGSGTTAFIPKFSSSSALTNSKIFETTNTISIGASTGIDAFTRLYVYGGSNGANIDARGAPGAATDQAVCELQGADYSTSFKSMWMRYQGTDATGTTLGLANANLGELTFADPDNVLLRVIPNIPMRFSINSVEQTRLDTSGWQLRSRKSLRFYDSDNTQYAELRAPSTSGLTTSYSLSLPVDDGTSGQYLKTDGSGALSWDTPSGGGGGGDFLGTGFTSGGGSGSIPDGTSALLDGEFEIDAGFSGFTSLFNKKAGYAQEDVGNILGFYQDPYNYFGSGSNLGSEGEFVVQGYFSSNEGSNSTDFLMNRDGISFRSKGGGISTSFTGTGSGLSFNRTGVGFFGVNDNGFQMSSTTKPFYPPKMTESERDAMTVSEGATMYCTDCTATDSSTGVTQTYNGSTWKNHW